MSDEKKAKVLRMPITGSPASILSAFLDDSEDIISLAMILEVKGDDEDDDASHLVVCWSETDTSTLCLMSMAFDEKIRKVMYGDPVD